MCWILEGIKFPCLGASSSLGPPVLSGAQSEGSKESSAPVMCAQPSAQGKRDQDD